jgi:hypothetical protein
MTGSSRVHPPCSCCLGAAWYQWHPWSSGPYIWIWWIGCWCLGVGYNGPGLCCVWPWPIYLDAADKCASCAPWPWFKWNGQSAQCRLDNICRVCCTHLESWVPGHPSQAEGSWDPSLVGVGPHRLDLCLDSMQLMWIKVMLTKRRKAIQVGFSGVELLSLVDWEPIRSASHLSLSTWESEELQFMM